MKLSGGALIEGVMIKNEGQFAMALRKGNSDIEIVHDVYKGILGRGSFNKIPILRGIFALIDCMGLGIKTFLFSSDFYEDNTKVKVIYILYGLIGILLFMMFIFQNLKVFAIMRVKIVSKTKMTSKL